MIIGEAGEGVYIDDLTHRVHRPAEEDGYLGELSTMRLEVELLRDENAKLRYLVRIAYECARYSDPSTCDDCLEDHGKCLLEKRMEELEMVEYD